MSTHILLLLIQAHFYIVAQSYNVLTEAERVTLIPLPFNTTDSSRNKPYISSPFILDCPDSRIRSPSLVYCCHAYLSSDRLWRKKCCALL